MSLKVWETVWIVSACVRSGLTFWNIGHVSLFDFFHEHESRHCLRLTLSTNSLEVFRCSCLWWKCGEIRTFLPTLSSASTLSHNCRQLCLPATPTAWLSPHHVCRCGNTDLWLQIASFVYFISPVFNGIIGVLMHRLALKDIGIKTWLNRKQSDMEKLLKECFFVVWRWYWLFLRQVRSWGTVWSQAGRWQSSFIPYICPVLL